MLNEGLELHSNLRATFDSNGQPRAAFSTRCLDRLGSNPLQPLDSSALSKNYCKGEQFLFKLRSQTFSLVNACCPSLLRKRRRCQLCQSQVASYFPVGEARLIWLCN